MKLLLWVVVFGLAVLLSVTLSGFIVAAVPSLALSTLLSFVVGIAIGVVAFTTYIALSRKL